MARKKTYAQYLREVENEFRQAARFSGASNVPIPREAVIAEARRRFNDQQREKEEEGRKESRQASRSGRSEGGKGSRPERDRQNEAKLRSIDAKMTRRLDPDPSVVDRSQGAATPRTGDPVFDALLQQLAGVGVTPAGQAASRDRGMRTDHVFGSGVGSVRIQNPSQQGRTYPTMSSLEHGGQLQREATGVAIPSPVWEAASYNERKYLPLIVEAAERFGIDPGLLYGLIKTESNFNPNARNSSNGNGTTDYGIAQINSSTLRGIGKSADWALNPRNAIFYAAERLANSMSRYGSKAAALIEYNGGAGRANQFVSTGRWPYAAAQGYVEKVLGYASAFDPNGNFEYDGPEIGEEPPVANITLSSQEDIQAVADAIGQEVIGRNLPPEAKKKVVQMIWDYQRAHQTGEFAAALNTQAQAEAAAVIGGSGMTPQQYWGNQGVGNGRIPGNQLMQIGRGGHALQADAARAFMAMDAAARNDGIDLGITDSYRSYAAQVDVKRRKPGLAATPGKSNHGWGVAVDLATGGWNGKAYNWLVANAGRFGFVHPEWARKDGSKPEHWHWEYRGPMGGTPVDQGAAEMASGGGFLVNTSFDDADVENLISRQIESMFPEEAAATKIANIGDYFLAMLGVTR